MKRKLQRLFTTLLALALVCGLFAGLPRAVFAADTATLKTTIESFDHGGAGSLTAAVSGNTVTVTGAVSGVTNCNLDLNISSGVTVIWKASYTGAVDTIGYSLVAQNGSGTFELASGGLIENTNGASAALSVSPNSGAKTIISGGALRVANAQYTVLCNDSVLEVSGGAVENAGANGIAVMAQHNQTINISGGAITATGTNGVAINIGAMGSGKVNISGGTVESTKYWAIYNESVQTEIIVSGSGAVKANGTNGRAICNSGGSAQITVSGGTVEANEGIALANIVGGTDSKITVSGGTLQATTGFGIGVLETNTTVTVTGGAINATTGAAIGVNAAQNTVVVSGGSVSATTGFGIAVNGKNVTTTVSGGKVSATNQAAIAVNGDNSTVKLSGGLVFAYGQDITGEGNVINMLNGGAPAIGDAAVICAWNKPSGTPTYNAGDQTDLIVAPAGAAATWGKDGAQNGVSYTNGANLGFFPINDITVSAAANAAPTINGPTGLTLYVGYTATSTGVYTIIGNPAPKVEKISGNASILWNDSAKKLEIAAGLPQGTYNVVLKAQNSLGEVEFSFTLMVTEPITYVNPFTDVKETDWFYKDLMYAYSKRLVNGKTATTFAPNDNLTYAEAVKLATCMFQLWDRGSVTLVNGSPLWYSTYVENAKQNGFISQDYDWNAPATRAGYMEIFAKALPLEEINTVADGAIPDVPMTHPQAAAIYKLYRAGIVQGVDAAHTCSPNANIKRNEVATIIARMMDRDARLSFTLE